MKYVHWSWLILLILCSACSHTSPKSYPPALNMPEISQPYEQDTNALPEPEEDFQVVKEKHPPPTDTQEICPEVLTPVYTLKFEITPQVQYWIEQYSGNNRPYFEKYLYKFELLQPKMEQLFTQYGTPTDLVYLCLIESCANPNAVSHAGATGYWQFMPKTARRYGLTVNRWIDERRDLEKSTVAAAAYLNHLHSIFDDWLLACAAYNAGEGTIIRITKRYPQVETFWDITPKMPIKKETRSYVPKFLAALVMAKNPQEYCLNTDKPSQIDLSYDVVSVNTFTTFDELSEIAGYSMSYIARLNPELIRGCTPPHAKSYDVKVPKGTAEKISAYLSRSHDPQVRYITHTISKGDTLYDLAKKYNSSVREIAHASRISCKDLLSINQVLIVPVYPPQARQTGHVHVVEKGDTLLSISSAYGIDLQDIVDINKLANPELIVPGMALRLPPKLPFMSGGKPITYQVKKGDTLWDISRQFAVSTKDILRWNKLESASLIYPGDCLTLYLSES